MKSARAHCKKCRQYPDGVLRKQPLRLPWKRGAVRIGQASGVSSTIHLRIHTRMEKNMTTQGFTVSHAQDADFVRGLRSYYEYRDLGIRQATGGKVAAHVIRAAAGTAFSSQPHKHATTFQLVYVLKGWIEFEYEGQGIVRLEAGSCVHQPPEIRHREVGHSEDIEMLEIVLPAGFKTEEVASVDA